MWSLFFMTIIAGYELGRAEGKTYNGNYAVPPYLDLSLGLVGIIVALSMIIFP